MNAIDIIFLFVIGAIITQVEFLGDKICVPYDKHEEEIKKETERAVMRAERAEKDRLVKQSLIDRGVIPPDGLTDYQQEKWWQHKGKKSGRKRMGTKYYEVKAEQYKSLYGASDIPASWHMWMDNFEQEEHKNKISNHDNYIDFDESKS